MRVGWLVGFFGGVDILVDVGRVLGVSPYSSILGDREILYGCR